MKLIKDIIVIFIGMGFLITACSTGQASTGAKLLVVTPAINGNSAELAVGDVLEIRLPTIPSPGYAWQVEDLDSQVLIQVGDAVYTPDTSENSAGGITTVKFEAVGPGSSTALLLFTGTPSQQKPALSSDSFSLAVTVK
jgi:predicted secreted protein